MKTTYTAEDGRTWETEAECLSWEQECRRFEAFKGLAIAAIGRKVGHPDMDEDFGDFLEEVLDCGWDLQGCKSRWEQRGSFYRLADLMRQAEAVG